MNVYGSINTSVLVVVVIPVNACMKSAVGLYHWRPKPQGVSGMETWSCSRNGLKTKLFTGKELKTIWPAPIYEAINNYACLVNLISAAYISRNPFLVGPFPSCHIIYTTIISSPIPINHSLIINSHENKNSQKNARELIIIFSGIFCHLLNELLLFLMHC